MFSQNYAYYYDQPETELFQRELPYKSIKLPVKKREQEKHILRYTQKKYEVEQLKMQIFHRCKLEQLEYLELLKKQREVMEEDIKRRKKEIQIRNLQQGIALNKKNQEKEMQKEQEKEMKKQKVKDSLDQLQNQHEIHKHRSKTQRTESAYSSSISSIGSTQIMSARKETSQKSETQPMQIILQKQVQKDGQLKKIKQEMLKKYGFMGEGGKKPQKTLRQETTQVRWWIDKVKRHRQKEAKQQKKKKQNDTGTVYSDTNSEDSNK